jgi:hypothetical protein
VKAFKRISIALVLVLVCLPVFADDCPAIQSFSANDVQTGEPVTFTWSYTGGAPQTQTLTGHDFDTPILFGPDVRIYTYTPSKPGMKHAQIAGVTSCGTISTGTKYKVKQCNVVAPVMAVDQTSVAPGAVINASVELKPGHSVRWEVLNGTASATTGSAIQVTAGGAGTVTINAWVSRGNSCAVLSTATVEVVAACAIAEPVVYHPMVAVADYWFYLFVDENMGPGETPSFAVRGAEIDFQDTYGVYVIAPSQGSFSIDVIVTNGTCTRTFTYTFAVEACNASAVVRPGQAGECGATTAIAEFSGTPPFQGSWSDGQYFFTQESSLERPISGGTYSLQWMMDSSCEGPVSGSVQGGTILPTPSYTVDGMVDGWWWGSDTCPGTVRTARLDGNIPAGATIEWSIPGGNILSGQGTPVVQYAGDAVGPTNLTVVFRDAEGCPSAPYVEEFAWTYGPPEVAVRVEPSTIPAGGTAIVTFELLNRMTGGLNLTSSLGDPIVPLGDGQYEYRSTNGGGVATITATANGLCSTTEVTTTLTVDGGNPVQATAKVQASGNSCSDFAIAQFTGVPPFTGTWSNGETFTTPESYIYLRPFVAGTYTLDQFSDANGPGTVTGSATFEFEQLPQPEFDYNVESTCPNGVVTATLTTPLPEGATANWYVYYGELLSGQGTSSIQIRAGESGWVGAGVSLSAPNACSPNAVPKNIPIQTFRQPFVATYPLHQGEEAIVGVYIDENTASWEIENSFGDPMEVLQNPDPGFYTVRYTSTHGTGDSIVRVYGTTACGTAFETTGVMTILPPRPTATVTSEPHPTCGSNVTATFTGTAPFTGTWWDGEPFTTNESTITRQVTVNTWVYVSVQDANGGGAMSAGISPQMKQFDPIPISGPYELCIGTQGTVTIELPQGWTVQWSVQSPVVRIVSGETAPSVVIEAMEGGWALVEGLVRTPEGCAFTQSHYVYVPAPQGNPVITLPATTIQAGDTFDFTVAFDGNYQSLGWESSNGDGVWNLGQDGMTFTLRYQSVNGPGTTTIRAYGTTVCGAEVEATATLVIEP